MSRGPVRRSVFGVTLPQAPIASPLVGLTVHDAMHPGVVTCLPDAALSTVASNMAIHGIHSVVLSQPERGTPLIVTDLELVRAALEGADDARAADIAREPAATLSSDASLDDAVVMMAIGYVAHLLATDPSSGAPATSCTAGSPRAFRTRRCRLSRGAWPSIASTAWRSAASTTPAVVASTSSGD
jgi:CBS domain-containing protein